MIDKTMRFHLEAHAIKLGFSSWEEQLIAQDAGNIVANGREGDELNVARYALRMSAVARKKTLADRKRGGGADRYIAVAVRYAQSLMEDDPQMSKSAAARHAVDHMEQTLGVNVNSSSVRRRLSSV
ncbi:hypothetical protein [Aliiruegeria sabulilitoris]|uniref:hypothetical protein n=1 Tax=Aliiruegeria sabulilitoris TaxID=1510458 RepID=UPI00082FE53E|nr:hypothetical protein [Aliiruegeria sabulilitoris]NDR55299.1 hypothetical protein [Pseudoruegeria sp. M32A2M]